MSEAFAAPAAARAALERADQAEPKTITYGARTATYTAAEQRLVLRMAADGCPPRELKLIHAVKSAFDAVLSDA